MAVLAITISSGYHRGVCYNRYYSRSCHKPGRRRRPARNVVFRESIKRYAWLAAPIASGYGIAQVISRVAEIVSGGS